MSETSDLPGIQVGARRLGNPRVHLRRTASTNDRARELALRGAPHGTLVTADEQTAGRGRHGRRWSAPARSALLMSLLLRWSPKESLPALLPLAAAVAVCDVAGPDALVKWPNDVVLRSAETVVRTESEKDDRLRQAQRSGRYAGLAKLAGILVEGRPQERWLVLGIGLNVAVDLAQLPDEVRHSAASLGRAAEAIEPTLAQLLAALHGRLAEPPAGVLAAWRSRDALLGEPVRWSGGSGQAEGVSERGGLLVRSPDGALVELSSGEVQLA